MIDYKKGPFIADVNGGYIWSLADGTRKMFAQVRGWGWLQKLPNAEATQDAHLQFICDALNEKAGHKTP